MYEPTLHSVLLYSNAFNGERSRVLPARTTAFHQKERQGTIGPNWEQRLSKCCVFPHKVTPQDQGQLSAHHEHYEEG